MNYPLFLSSSASSSGSSAVTMIIWIVVLFVFMYFLMIRPQQKETKKKNALMNSLAVGDTVLTTSGFYGVVIDIDEDTIIVEFGSNKNCRIPMQKSAIAAVEKPEDAAKAAESEDKTKDKKEK
ncbi:MAG: preprotein translocase subunit YajC [bacterium LCO1.1]|uniref:Preprotein translocase subunit YajC n=1 Tax=Candidatus Weimeria bifida TaxID=2599074 RepID=A0A6N7IYL5_9FIRM|nr:preprotein translocase subunit YajC [Candidatus Weimeria bifida]